MAEPARVLRAAEDGRTFGDTVITLVAPVLLSLSLFVTAESVRRMLRRLAAAKAHAQLTGVGPPVPQEEMAQAHDALINVILEEEEAVIAAHRAQTRERVCGRGQ